MLRFQTKRVLGLGNLFLFTFLLFSIVIPLAAILFHILNGTRIVQSSLNQTLHIWMFGVEIDFVSRHFISFTALT